MDRLSQLPDSLIISILSLLPTVKAARTSLVSKQWKNLWTHVSTIDLTDHNNNISDYNQRCELFKTFVTNLLTPRPDSQTIEKLKLEFTQGSFNYSTDLNTWLEFAFSRGLTHLHIKSKYCLFPSIIPSVFSLAAKNLRTLRLTNLSEVYPNTTHLPSFHLSHLKFLQLEIANPDDHILEQLFCPDNFPTLVTLYLQLKSGNDQYDFDFAADLRITSHTLNRLKLDIIGWIHNTVVVQLDTPTLRYINLAYYDLQYLVAYEEHLNTTVFLSKLDPKSMRQISNVLETIPSLCEISEPVQELSLTRIVAENINTFNNLVVEFKSHCRLEDQYFLPSKMGEIPWYFGEGRASKRCPWYFHYGLKLTFE